MFVDETEVSLRAGKGGDGCMSFRRERYIPFGGPDGGDGGEGGCVILECDHNVADFTAYRFKPNWTAENGQPGQGRLKYGRKGAHCILKMPAGTQVIEPESGLKVAELLKPGESVTLLKGGKGGRGNAYFRSSTNRAPRQTEMGTEGESGRFRLVLKTIADVGLVGFPNAGKSTLLTQMTAAHPKIGEYPFTTLFPCVGMCEAGAVEKPFSIADIPGLIEGAHQNRGLGHRFLKHIERCHLLVIVLDTSGQEGRDPLKDYQILEHELGCYNEALLKKPRIVVANKLDLEESAENLKLLRKKITLPLYEVSQFDSQGIDALKKELAALVRAHRPEPLAEQDAPEQALEPFGEMHEREAEQDELDQHGASME